MSDAPVIPRTVHPLKLTDAWLPVMAVDQDSNRVLTEQGELLDLRDLGARLITLPPSLVIVQGAARLLRDLDPLLEHHPQWQFRISPIRRDVMLPNGTLGKVQVQQTVVNFFGFSPASKSKRGHYFYPLDPTLFTKNGIHELVEGEDSVLVKLLSWGMDVRSWCHHHGIRPKPSNGAIAGQLLRHPSFFPESRRKVPRATNNRARFTLPGNYYRLHVPENSTWDATYLDMKSAHHNIAADLSFPDPDTLRAYGYFRVTDGTEGTELTDTPWARIGTPRYRRVMGSHGLLYVHLSVPKLKMDRFPLPYLERPGGRMAWVYSNELPALRALGVAVDWVTGAWVSPDVAPGLNRYARWAMDELGQADAGRRAWLKATLLASYGVLAARPRPQEYAFKRAVGGIPRRYPAGSGMLEATARITDATMELPTANVIYRGMIEAEQRVRSLALARDLHAQGHHVLAVYADSVFVEAGRQLPLLPPPWVIERELDRLTFLSSTAFTSPQLTKLPGIPKEGLDRVRRLEAFRRRT